MFLFRQCSQAISNLARPHAPMDIQITTAGPVQWRLDGKRVAPLRTWIIYERQGGFEKRVADVLCTLDENGRVLEIIDRYDSGSS
jgi:hypothetical protein